jgi:hypothetical protein
LNKSKIALGRERPTVSVYRSSIILVQTKSKCILLGAKRRRPSPKLLPRIKARPLLARAKLGLINSKPLLVSAELWTIKAKAKPLSAAAAAELWRSGAKLRLIEAKAKPLLAHSEFWPSEAKALLACSELWRS